MAARRRHSQCVWVGLAFTLTALTAAANPGLADELLALNPPSSTQVEDGDGTLCNLGAIGPVVRARLVVRDTRRAVGPYVVRLPGYATADSEASTKDDVDAIDSFAPFIIRAKPGDTLRIDLVNHLRDADIIPAPDYESQANKDAGDKAINLHTHGLIVKPRPYGPCGSVGDNIFTLADWKNVARYRIDIPKRIKGAYLNAPKDDPDHDTGHDDGPYPAGPYWFHAHVHGFAKPDVLSGQSGFLSIDCPTGASAAACPNSPAHLHAEEQVITLRDIQVLARQGQTPDVLPPLPNPLPPNAAETAFYNRSIDYDPALCASLTTDLSKLDLTKLQPGFCVASNPNPDLMVSQVNG
jgi:hypothetical protein